MVKDGDVDAIAETENFVDRIEINLTRPKRDLSFYLQRLKAVVDNILVTKGKGGQGDL